MSVARTARRRRKQALQNNSQFSGLGVSRHKMPEKFVVRTPAKKAK